MESPYVHIYVVLGTYLYDLAFLKPTFFQSGLAFIEDPLSLLCFKIIEFPNLQRYSIQKLQFC